MKPEPDAKARVVAAFKGDPERLDRCTWVSDGRLVCTIYGVAKAADGSGDILPFSRVIALDSDGGNARMLSTRQNDNAEAVQLYGGGVIDWLPGEDDHVLMERVYIPDAKVGSRAGSETRGLGVDRVNTANIRASRVEAPRDSAIDYISDGRGNIRVMATRRVQGATQMDSGVLSYFFRRKGARDWEPFGTWDRTTREGFLPVAVDPDLDAAYGLQKLDGRMALYRVRLDGTGQRELVLARPDVDVDGLIRVGRQNRVVGASYATDIRHAVYFDAEIKKIVQALGKAIPDKPMLRIVDTSNDERRLLIWAGADNDPGVYYLFDRDRRELNTFLVSRPELEGVTLASVKPVSYPAADGTLVPAYLTLPPGSNGRNLPAIVLPHGGPSARDEWGFDWLSQYYAHQGYAVIQPNFRGSAGYGDAWFEQNGFQSWRTAIGDVSDAGRWLVKEGIADPSRLGIVGWSYGGYAALQSAVVNPDLFKAVVAIAPVTDLAALKLESRNWSNFRLVADFIGAGPHIVEGSPAQNAEAIRASVLMFHGDLDRNVSIAQSELMARRLQRAGKQHRLVSFKGLDHYIEDSDARTTMLRESDAFLKQAFSQKR